MNFDFSELELNNKQSIYLQIIKFIKIQLHLGKLKNGYEMPSRRVLATMLNINPATVQKTYKQLEDEGLIVTMQNSKSIVAVDMQTLDKIKKELTENEVRDFLRTAKNIELSFKDVIELISQLWEES